NGAAPVTSSGNNGVTAGSNASVPSATTVASPVVNGVSTSPNDVSAVTNPSSGVTGVSTTPLAGNTVTSTNGGVTVAPTTVGGTPQAAPPGRRQVCLGVRAGRFGAP